MAKYLTPDFDVTIYDLQDEITVVVGGGDPDDGFTSENEGPSSTFSGDVTNPF